MPFCVSVLARMLPLCRPTVLHDIHKAARHSHLQSAGFFRLAHYLSALPQFAVVTGTLYRSIVPCMEFLFVFGIVFLG